MKDHLEVQATRSGWAYPYVMLGDHFIWYDPISFPVKAGDDCTFRNFFLAPGLVACLLVVDEQLKSKDVIVDLIEAQYMPFPNCTVST